MSLIFLALMFILLANVIESESGSMVLAVSGLVLLVGVAGYISFGLRCPRCASWIPPPSPRSRCTSCGLALEAGSGVRPAGRE